MHCCFLLGLLFFTGHLLFGHEPRINRGLKNCSVVVVVVAVVVVLLFQYFLN